MKTAAPFLRVTGFIIISFLFLEFLVDSGNQLTIIKYPIVLAILGFMLLFAIAFEFILEALKTILYKSLDSEAQNKYLERESNRYNWIKKAYLKLLGSKPIETENDIVLDHNYDGIRELDNDLPPWWTYMFYASIVFAVVYMLKYHVFDGIDQAQEYEIAVIEAKRDIAEYKKTAKDLVDANTVELLTDSADLKAGASIYSTNCVACHKPDGGGGIGPNLTDRNWILGGGIKNVFTTISEGGRDGKGMISWKSELKPAEMAQVASYILSFQGTTPAEPKDAEGEIWED